MTTTTTPLYDVRMFSDSNKRMLHRAPINGFYVATVREVQGALRGWPDMAAVREGLMPQHRKAFDRAGQFWANKCDDSKPLSLTLYTARGRLIGTLYATRREV